MIPLLILRPEPGASRTAAVARKAGWAATAAPLFTVAPLVWDAPDPSRYDALLLTSANAVRHAGDALGAYRLLPAYAVGEATAGAAAEAGLSRIITGGSDGAATIGKAFADGHRKILHLAGRDHILLEHRSVKIDRRLVYASEAVTRLPPPAIEALKNGAIALLHSPRAAKVFGALIDTARLTRSQIPIVGFSPAVIAAAGGGWAAARAAEQPHDKSLLEIAARLCEQDDRRQRPQ
jgi:uroporphyrinogen-III synthase